MRTLAYLLSGLILTLGHAAYAQQTLYTMGIKKIQVVTDISIPANAKTVYFHNSLNPENNTNLSRELPYLFTFCMLQVREPKPVSRVVKSDVELKVAKTLPPIIKTVEEIAPNSESVGKNYKVNLTQFELSSTNLESLACGTISYDGAWQLRNPLTDDEFHKGVGQYLMISETAPQEIE